MMMSDVVLSNTGQQGRADVWLSILTLSTNMIEAAVAEDWEQVQVLDSQRGGLIEAFFSQAIAPHESALVERGIQKILQSDQQVIALGRERQQVIMMEVGQLSHNKRAVAAYSSHQQ